MYLLLTILIFVIQGVVLFFGGKLILTGASYFLVNAFKFFILKDKTIRWDIFIILFFQLVVGVVIIKLGFVVVNYLQGDIFTTLYTQHVRQLSINDLKFSYTVKIIGIAIGLCFASGYNFLKNKKKPSSNHKIANNDVFNEYKKEKTTKSSCFSNPNKESYHYNKEHLSNKKKPFKHKVTNSSRKKEPYTNKRRSNISKNNTFKYK